MNNLQINAYAVHHFYAAGDLLSAVDLLSAPALLLVKCLEFRKAVSSLTSNEVAYY